MGLVRVTLAAAALLEEAGTTAHVVAVPLPAHGEPDYDHHLGQLVAGNYATGDVLALGHAGEWPAQVAEIVDQDQPGDDERGFVVFFTGLSGSGKSTLARALHDLILEDGRRSVTSLDGDVVRRNLSAGPDLLPGGPRDQHPPDRLGRRGDRSPPRHRHLLPDRAVRRDPQAGAPDGRGRRCRLRPGARRDAPGGVRAPRPQGPLREGPPRGDPRVHRHLQPLRGARRRSCPRRHHRSDHRGLPRRDPAGAHLPRPAAPR